MEETKAENKTLEEKKQENQALWSQLTKRNEQYMMSLDKHLTEANVSEERKQDQYYAMMTELVASQKAGRTARQLYGTVSECAENILKKKEEAPSRSSNWLIALDGGLLLGSMFALISGITLLTTKQENAVGMGIISLIVNYVAAGAAMLIISKYTPNPDAQKGQKGYGKYIGATTVAMLLWFIAMMLPQLLPATINLPLPSVAYLVIAAAGIGAKIYLKKKYRITGGLF